MTPEIPGDWLLPFEYSESQDGVEISLNVKRVCSDDSTPDTTECDNCGRQRYTFERCQHCGHVHWRED